MQVSGQPNGLGSELGPLELRSRSGRITLVEDQVQDLENGPESLGPLVFRWHAEPGPGGPDALLGSAYALGHGFLGNEEGTSDLGRRQAADRTQGQRDLRGRR